MDHAWIRVDHAWIEVGRTLLDSEPAVAPGQVVRANDSQLGHHRSQIPAEGLRGRNVVAVVLCPVSVRGVQLLAFDLVVTTAVTTFTNKSGDGRDQILELQNRFARGFRDRERLR